MPRKKLPPETRQCKRLIVNLTVEEFRQLEKDAEEAKIYTSTYARKILLSAMREAS